MTSTDEWVLSDMRDAGEREWRAFSDRVMGGISREHVSVAQIDGLRCLRLQGEAPPRRVETLLDLDGPSTARLAVYLTSAANQAIADALKAAR